MLDTNTLAASLQNQMARLSVDSNGIRNIVHFKGRLDLFFCVAPNEKRGGWVMSILSH